MEAQKIQRDLCFGTLALGQEYSDLAKLLAQDLEHYAPEISLVILTDRPHVFIGHSNVLAFKHHQHSIGCYHDKRFVIAKALSLFDACMFIDADMRILSLVNNSIQYSPGITAYRVWDNILKHNKNNFQISLLKTVASKLSLDLIQVSFVHECLFVVAKDDGKENQFLATWETIAPYFESKGYYRGEGNSIGLAAAHAGLSIKQSYFKGFNFFKDRFEKQKQKRGEVLSQDVLDLMAQQRKCEYPQKSSWQSFLLKVKKILVRLRCDFYMKLSIIRNFKFHYLK
jgi:hypothetical protein